MANLQNGPAEHSINKTDPVDVDPNSTVETADDGAQNRLTPALIARIEACLQEVGEYGEVHLKVMKGRIRFLCTVKSMDTAVDIAEEAAPSRARHRKA